MVLGDSGHIRAWSNIPYFLFRAAKGAGFLTHTLNTLDSQYKVRSVIWNLLSPLRLEKSGGYQLSRTSVMRMWNQVPQELRGGEFLSHFQLFPPLEPARAAGARHSFYCDATLSQLHSASYPGVRPWRVGRRTWADALAREGELYRSAKFYIGMAKATVDSAIRDYGVEPAKAFVVRPGANLDEDIVLEHLARRGPSWRESGEPFGSNRPARLGFIGRDYQRKGLPRLIEAAEILHGRGRAVRVSVIGACPQEYANHPLVESIGLIDKATDMKRFIEAVDTFAIGCLPSYSEPLGISTLEALRLGVPVMGTNTGGIPDCVPPEGGFLVPVDATGDVIADAIEHHVFDPGRYDRLQRGAVREMPNVTWSKSVQKLMQIWAAK